MRRRIYPEVRASWFAYAQLGGTYLYGVRRRFVVLACTGISIGHVPGHRFRDRDRRHDEADFCHGDTAVPR